MQFTRVFGHAFSLETTIAEVVFALVIAAMLAAFAQSWLRRKRGREPSRREKRNGLEGLYLLGLVGMAAFLIAFSLTENSDFWRDPPARTVIRVTAFQWCWDFNYPARHVSVSGQCKSGLAPTVVVPSGQPVRFEMTSRDVVHSFWVPALRFKMDIYPDHVNSFTTTLRPGHWRGRCALFCGLFHYGMVFYLKAVPPAQFARWLQSRGAPTHAAAGT